jgi:hypothetical protein
VSRFNSLKYYFIPISDLTDDMVLQSCLTSRETARLSVRPIDGKIHTIIKFMPSTPLPDYMKSYKEYTHEEILNATRTSEWNLHQPIVDLQATFNFEKVLSDFDQQNYIQCFGETYITVFQILKFKFLIHSMDYLDDENKWKIFSKGSRFEKANEFTLLELNYFYNLISKEDKDFLTLFRNLRNDVSHSFVNDSKKDEWRNNLIEVNKLIVKYFIQVNELY